MLNQRMPHLSRWILASSLAAMLCVVAAAGAADPAGTYGPLRPITPGSAPASMPAAPSPSAMGAAASMPAVAGGIRAAATQPSTMLPPPASQAAGPRPTSLPAGMPVGMILPSSQPASNPALSPEARLAQQQYNSGLAALNAGDLLGARAHLSTALASGALPAELTTPCRNRLTEIAQKVVFGPEVYPGDADAYYYTLKNGDVLVKVVKNEKLFVNDTAIQRINGIANVKKLRAGQRIKLVRGPFDAIVTKHTYTLDLYHAGMFIKSYRIGLGLAGKTPVGKFMVKPGGRVPQAPWTSPVGGKMIYFGQPGYPLGRSGDWIGLEAAEVGTPDLPGFGIHGTNEPESIGHDASSGCIRLSDEDIEELFGLMYDGMSKVEIRP